ncbi:hypothetical protein GW931_02825 [archaeon]|nr:hypothetical protein [archaeon]
MKRTYFGENMNEIDIYNIDEDKLLGLFEQMVRLKIGENYISGDKIQMGVPQMDSELQNAKIFTYSEAISKMQMICFEARMIEI